MKENDYRDAQFAVTFAERWKDYDGKDEHNGKCMQSKK